MNTTNAEGAKVKQTRRPVDLSPATAKENYIRTARGNRGLARARGAVDGAHRRTTGDYANLNIAVPRETLREEGIEDARDALGGTGHPGGNSEEPIWKATHSRAIVDLAFDR